MKTRPIMPIQELRNLMAEQHGLRHAEDRPWLFVDTAARFLDRSWFAGVCRCQVNRNPGQQQRPGPAAAHGPVEYTAIAGVWVYWGCKTCHRVRVCVGQCPACGTIFWWMGDRRRVHMPREAWKQ